MTAQIDAIVANLQRTRSSDKDEPIIVDVDTLIAALQVAGMGPEMLALVANLQRNRTSDKDEPIKANVDTFIAALSTISNSSQVLAGGFNTPPPAAFDTTWPESGVNVQFFTVSGVYTKPANCIAIRIILMACGGGGASGSAGTLAAQLFSHGGGAGGGGERLDQWINPAIVGANENVTIGAAGVGGATRAV